MFNNKIKKITKPILVYNLFSVVHLVLFTAISQRNLILCGFTINMLHLQYCACHGQTLSQEMKQKKLIPEGLVAVVSGWKGKGVN